MPTGYTADVADGKVTELEDYILTAARGMGFAMHLRDSGDAKIIRREESSYYKEAYAKALEAQRRWDALDESHRKAEFFKDTDGASKRYREAIKRDSETDKRYELMIEKVEAWKVPDLLESTKDFALSQLQESRQFDGGGDYYQNQLDRMETITYDEWLRDHEESLERDVDRNMESWLEERERVLKANEYITGIYESLGLEVPE